MYNNITLLLHCDYQQSRCQRSCFHPHPARQVMQAGMKIISNLLLCLNSISLIVKGIKIGRYISTDSLSDKFRPKMRIDSGTSAIRQSCHRHTMPFAAPYLVLTGNALLNMSPPGLCAGKQMPRLHYSSPQPFMPSRSSLMLSPGID